MSLLKLSKIFSREKGVWYAYVWDESDRLGFNKYLNHKVNHNLFIREGEKLSVFYNSSETEKIHKKIRNKYLHDKKFVDQIFIDLSREWKRISPYLEKIKHIKSFNDLRGYYFHLVRWWAAMAILFRLDLPAEQAKSALEYRQKAEKFSDIMIEIWDNFFVKKGLRKLMNLITPEEAFMAAKLSPEKIIDIENRSLGIALYNSRLYPSGQVRQILKRAGLKIEEKNVDNISKFKGTSAFKGRITGFVTVVLLNKEISKVKKGDILVAEMTSPDYLPAIKKSAGLVTDEGGITSHAAIVSRELKKPCILATRIATKVLRDGDLIEMNANNGTVKILKKAD